MPDAGQIVHSRNRSYSRSRASNSSIVAISLVETLRGRRQLYHFRSDIKSVEMERGDYARNLFPSLLPLSPSLCLRLVSPSFRENSNLRLEQTLRTLSLREALVERMAMRDPSSLLFVLTPFSFFADLRISDSPPLSPARFRGCTHEASAYAFPSSVICL